MNRVRILAMACGLLNLVLWFAVVPLRNAYDAARGQLEMPFRPHIMFGVQELLMYFDPWLSLYFFPAVYTLGFAVLSWWIPTHFHRRATSWATSTALIGLEALWVLLVVWTIVLRGPQWEFRMPFEDWEPGNHWPNDQWLVQFNAPNLSDWFWYHILQDANWGGSWFLREIPGFGFLLGYVVFIVLATFAGARRIGWIFPYGWAVSMLGVILALKYRVEFACVVYPLLLVLGYMARRISQTFWLEATPPSSLPVRRSAAIAVLFGIAALVPLKMVLRWWLPWRYWISIPELGFNI